MKIIINILMLSVLASMLHASDDLQVQANLLADYYARALNLKRSQIDITLLHPARLEASASSQSSLSVQQGRGDVKLGRQTLWLVQKSDNRVQKRYPVTFEVSARLRVPLAARDISRQEIIDSQMIRFETKQVSRDYQRKILTKDDLIGKMANQLIREGKSFERASVRTAPDVLLGESLQIIVQNQGLTLELPGIAREEGQIGKEIRVQCPTTRKEFKGILQNQQMVLVNLR